MAKKAESDRYFMRLDKEHKRRLDHLAVDAGFGSTEAYAGHLVTEAIDRLWSHFDPKKPAAPARRKRIDSV
jgi:predicted DNA-binding protein